MSSGNVKRIAAAGAMALAVLVAGSASAQQGTGLDPRWTAWLGCWEPEAALEGATDLDVVRALLGETPVPR